jgi:hypothetical protein
MSEHLRDGTVKAIKQGHLWRIDAELIPAPDP